MSATVTLDMECDECHVKWQYTPVTFEKFKEVYSMKKHFCFECDPDYKKQEMANGEK